MSKVDVRPVAEFQAALASTNYLERYNKWKSALNDVQAENKELLNE